MKKLLILFFILCSALSWAQKYVPAEKQTFNVSTGLQDGRYMHITVTLTFGRYDVDENDTPRPSLYYIRSQVASLFAAQNSADISTKQQREAFKTKIADAVNSKLPKGGVVDISFSNYYVW